MATMDLLRDGYLSQHHCVKYHIPLLRASFAATAVLAIGLAAGYQHGLPLTACCLTTAVALGLGTGAVFRLVAG
jgi:nitrate/nitrite transporter NarK